MQQQKHCAEKWHTGTGVLSFPQAAVLRTLQINPINFSIPSEIRMSEYVGNVQRLSNHMQRIGRPPADFVVYGAPQRISGSDEYVVSVELRDTDPPMTYWGQALGVHRAREAAASSALRALGLLGQ